MLLATTEEAILHQTTPPPRPELETLRAELQRARRDLAGWEERERQEELVFCEQRTIDPRTHWNLVFHRRRIAALERALDEAVRADPQEAS